MTFGAATDDRIKLILSARFVSKRHRAYRFEQETTTVHGIAWCSDRWCKIRVMIMTRSTCTVTLHHYHPRWLSDTTSPCVSASQDKCW